MSNQSSASGGLSFMGLLTIVFITLKLCEVIQWSWWWVLSPLWLGVVAYVVIIALMMLVAGCVLGVTWLICAIMEKNGK